MASKTEQSVTLWIESLKDGDAEAARALWGRYFETLVGLARARLKGMPHAVADEEDAALSAFDSFCRGAARGRYPRLEDRDDLWKLLVVITERKALDQADECRSLLGQLRDDSLRAVALLRMEGYTSEEVSERLGLSLRTVARKLELIRRTWTEKGGDVP
jgi:hypothetical protein